MASDDETIGTIELELLTLVRLLETLSRRTTLYSEVDRSGYLALRMLDRRGPMATNALAETLQLDGSTVTRQINALASAGFADRHPNPTDRRSSDLVITSSGEATMKRVERERRKMLHAMFERWTPTDRADLGRMLTMLNGVLVDEVTKTM
jgi:DNA-binding MarR family transcriptional regulator